MADNRRFPKAVLGRVRTGAPRRDLDPTSGGWNPVFRRLRRRVPKGVFERTFEALRAAGPDLEHAAIADGTPIGSRRPILPPAVRPSGGDGRRGGRVHRQQGAQIIGEWWPG